MTQNQTIVESWHTKIGNDIAMKKEATDVRRVDAQTAKQRRKVRLKCNI